MRYVIVTFGFDGDVLPLVNIGKMLVDFGHSVTIISPPRYSDLVQSCGCESISLWRSEADSYVARALPLLATRYARFLIAKHVFDWNDIVYSVLRTCRMRDVIVVSGHNGLLWADLLCSREFRMRVVRVRLEPPKHPRFALPGFSQGTASSACDEMIKQKWVTLKSKLGIPFELEEIEGLRASTLPLVRMIALYPEWLVPGERTLSPGNGVTALPFSFVRIPKIRDEKIKWEESVRLDPLLVFVAGTRCMTSKWAGWFHKVSSEICVRLCCRGMVLGGEERERLTANGRVAWLECADLSCVLKGARAIVVCWACSAAWRCKSSGQPDGGEGLEKCKGYRREAGSERSMDQKCESMDKNRIQGASVGRAGNLSRSPYPSKVRSVDPAAVHGRRLNLPQEICSVSPRRLRLLKGSLIAEQKSAEGVLDREVGKASEALRKPKRRSNR